MKQTLNIDEIQTKILHINDYSLLLTKSCVEDSNLTKPQKSSILWNFVLTQLKWVIIGQFPTNCPKRTHFFRFFSSQNVLFFPVNRVTKHI